MNKKYYILKFDYIEAVVNHIRDLLRSGDDDPDTADDIYQVMDHLHSEVVINVHKYYEEMRTKRHENE